MTVKSHNGAVAKGDIVGYEGSYRFYGYKLLKKVWIDQLGEYQWIGQGANIAKGENTVNTTDTITLLNDRELKDGCKSVWTPGNAEEYKKGDILIGDDKGRIMLFVYIDDTTVERLTDRPGLGKVGYSTLADYEADYGPLKVHTIQSYSLEGKHDKPFSEL